MRIKAKAKAETAMPETAPETAPVAGLPETAMPETGNTLATEYGLSPELYAALDAINARRRAVAGGQASNVFDLRLKNTSTALDLHSSKAGARSVAQFTDRLNLARDGLAILYRAGVRSVQARILDAGQAAILINSGLLSLPSDGRTRGGADFMLSITGKHLPADTRA